MHGRETTVAPPDGYRRPFSGLFRADFVAVMANVSATRAFASPTRQRRIGPSFALAVLTACVTSRREPAAPTIQPGARGERARARP